MEQRRLGVIFCGQGLIGGVTVYDLRSWDLDFMLERCWWESVEEMVVIEWKIGGFAVVMRRRG